MKEIFANATVTTTPTNAIATNAANNSVNCFGCMALKLQPVTPSKIIFICPESRVSCSCNKWTSKKILHMIS